MNQKYRVRFLNAYHRIYGIIPQLVWDGTYYRSPHLPMALTPRRFRSHIIRLESRISS